MPSVPRAFCLMAIAIRFFSALVSLRAASIFRFTSLCSLSASKRFSARVPMPSSLDTCSSLCKLVIESVPISTWPTKRRRKVQLAGCFQTNKQKMLVLALMQGQIIFFYSGLSPNHYIQVIINSDGCEQSFDFSRYIQIVATALALIIITYQRSCSILFRP